MDKNANKIVLVTQKSRLQELMHKYNTKAQAQFHIEHMGADFSDYELEDETYQKSLIQDLHYLELTLKVEIFQEDR